MNLNNYIRDIADFPKKGIIFKDITPLLKNSEVFNYIIEEFKKRIINKKIDYIIGIESRGFILGAALAQSLNCGFVPIRKKGKLPYKVISETYDLEYGQDTLEMHIDALETNNNVVLISDWWKYKCMFKNIKNLQSKYYRMSVFNRNSGVKRL